MTDAQGERVDVCVYLTGANWLVRFPGLMNVQQEEIERKMDNTERKKVTYGGVGTCLANMIEWQETWYTLNELFSWVFLRQKVIEMNHSKSWKYFASCLSIYCQIFIFTAVWSANGRFPIFWTDKYWLMTLTVNYLWTDTPQYLLQIVKSLCITAVYKWELKYKYKYKYMKYKWNSIGDSPLSLIFWCRV